ncbi:hypothetical protein VPH219E481_0014 [Vibrio phage 219E48-1]|nr:hypothetical protein PODOV032v1_p0036 [Vibrio phage 219E41.1]QZI91142.1 hypothetical protein PODOV060v1_p0048 [Vibrio phage 234P8]QZI91565.1 hypothetical protein PODOV087v1_p0060 [Vibrio phage 431E45.1]QZI91651.1 hypothetical protein PODOV086v1_p0067 [Vibrio phage 431E46.1]QZI91684.1 hypothetical protein PODOV088v1_p0023 [Vibrio phage 431E48.2]
MTNEYYTPSQSASPGNTVRSAQFNDNNQEIIAGFDLLPPPITLFSGNQNFGPDTGLIENVYEVSIREDVITSYTDGLTIQVRPSKNNTGSSQVQLNNLGLRQIRNQNNENIVIGDILNNRTMVLRYNATTAFFILDTIDPESVGPFSYRYIGNISIYVGDTITEAISNNAYQFPDNSGQWYGPIQGQVFPITVPADPSSDDGWEVVTAASASDVNEGDSQIINGVIFPISSNSFLTLGNQTSQVPSGTSRLRVNTGTKIELLYIWTPSGDFASSAREVTNISNDDLGGWTVTTTTGTFTFLDRDAYGNRDLQGFASGSTVSPLGWGLNKPGVNNADAIQAALAHCQANDVSFLGAPVDVATDKTIFLPNFPSFNVHQIIDFAGMRIRPDDTVFKPMESGKLENGVWVSAMMDPLLDNPTFNTTLTGLVFVRTDPETKNGRVALGLKDWHQNCTLGTLIARNFQSALDSFNNFYLKYGNLKLQNAALASGERTGIGFIFRSNNNLNSIEQLVSINVDQGYLFEGLVTGLHIENISLELQNNGLVTTGEVRGMAVLGSYGEYNNVDSENFFDFQGPVFNVGIDGCYFVSSNPDTHIINSISSPRSAISFGKNNNLAGMLDETKIFRNKSWGFRTLGSPSESFGSNGSNLIFREDDLGVGTVVEKYAIDVFTGNATFSVGNVHNEIIPANYSGRMTRGFNSSRQPGLFNPVKDEVNGILTLSTKILNSTSQLVYFSARVADFINTKTWFVQIVGGVVYNFDGSVSSDITFTVDSDGFLVIRVAGIAAGNPFNFTGGEIRVI